MKHTKLTLLETILITLVLICSAILFVGGMIISNVYCITVGGTGILLYIYVHILDSKSNE